MNFRKLEKISLKNHPDFTEKWLQDKISEDPSMLGLGELIVRGYERKQPRAGRIDLLLQEVDSDRRYEVELQLGKSDESHIIRTIEYWDLERKRYPQYDHTAIIIAEDITSRFLNVIQLLNGNIPIIALQIEAYELDNEIGLAFIKIFDEINFGLIEEDEEPLVVVDRNYWVNKATPETVNLADKIHNNILKEIDNNLNLKYNKYYIGLTRADKVNNFLRFKPRKNYVGVEIFIDKNEEIEEKFESAEIDLLDYNRKWGKYNLQIIEEDLEENHELLKDIFNIAYDNWNF